jgi:threonine dehydrogenase-like Zn-dependent dehydrogenase
VLGDGAVGVGAVQAATLFDVAQVVLVGHHDDRLAIAERNGATHTVNAKRDDPMELIRPLTDSRGADAVIETISSSASLARGLEAVRHGGSMSVLGMNHFFEPVDQPYSSAFMRNVHIHPASARREPASRACSRRWRRAGSTRASCSPTTCPSRTPPRGRRSWTAAGRAR